MKQTKFFRQMIAGIGIVLLAVGVVGCSNSATDSAAAPTTGEVITDELGSYAKLSIASDSKYLLPGARKYREDEQTLLDAGFSPSDIDNAQKVAVSFANTELIDNASLDLTNLKSQTLLDLSAKYFAGDYVDEFTAPDSQIIYSAPKGVQMVRDGGARVLSNSPTHLAASLNHGAGGGLLIEGWNEVVYRVIPSEATRNKDTMKVILAWAFKLEPDANGEWKITGYSNEYESFAK